MENEKKPGKRRILNIFDIVVLIVILALAAVLYFVRQGGDQATAHSEKIRYTVEFAQLEPAVAERITVGHQMIDRIKKYRVGTVESVELSPSVDYMMDYENGGVVRTEHPLYKRALVTLTADATVTDTQITLDTGYVLRVGMSVVIKGPGYLLGGTVMAIEREDAA